MKILMDGRNNGVGTSGSGVCSINEASCWNNKCNCYGALVCSQNYNKGDGYVAKTDVK